MFDGWNMRVVDKKKRNYVHIQIYFGFGFLNILIDSRKFIFFKKLTLSLVLYVQH